MKTLLVLAQHPDMVEAIRSGLNPEQYRVIYRANSEEAEPLLVNGLADVCIVDVELTSVQGVWFLEKLRRRAPKCPVILYTGPKEWEWEEEAYLKGATHVLNKPVRPRMLMTLLERLWPAVDPGAELPRFPAPFPSSERPIAAEASHPVPAAAQTLGVLRDFSGILTHSLNSEGMLKQFLLLLREILSINRAAIFLRQPFAPIGNGPVLVQNPRLRAACAVGLSPGLLQHFELSFESGIGGLVFRLGRILRRHSEEARQDLETQKEFELLGGQVAVPILDRETVLGVAVFDGRVTGEPLVNSELQLVFHLLEQLGLAIKNIWLHDQLSTNHEMMAGILRELSSACILVSKDLTILHANKMARRYFGGTEHRGGELEFSHLPQLLGARIYQVLKTGAAVSSFKYEPEGAPGTVYSITVVPFQKEQAGLPASALLMAEDLTQTRQLQKLEIETANLRLVRNMAERLTNEIGNALVPLAVHQQVLDEKLGAKKVDSEFLRMMERDLAESVKRVTRLTHQMRFLAREAPLSQDAFPVTPLLEEALQEARRHHPAKVVELKCETGGKSLVVKGDRNALKHAFSEVLLNAIQANPAEAKIGVRLQYESNGNGNHGLQIEVQDNGSGFTSEAVQKASTPFFTTKVVGLGLGLAVTRKIVEAHRGKLEIVPPGQPAMVRISLPMEVATS
jgi:signal transduction histidine kinase